MTTANYPACVAVVRRNEGGYVNNPKDPGGATNFGVTQATYNAWRKQQNLPTQSVRVIDQNEVAAIYQTYFDGANLPVGLDLIQLDGAINSGKVQGNKWVQIGVGANPVDGHIGPETEQAANDCKVPDAIMKACNARLSWLKTLSIWGTFGNGWSNRIAYTEAQALQMHANDVSKPVSVVTSSIAASAQSKSTQSSVAALGALAGGAGGLFESIKSAHVPVEVPIAIGVVAVVIFVVAAALRQHHFNRMVALHSVTK